MKKTILGLLIIIGLTFVFGCGIVIAQTDEGNLFQIPGLVPKPEVVKTLGPDGEVASWYSEISLTPDEVEKVKSMNLKAAFELVAEAEWNRASLLGFQDAGKALNIETVGIASAEFDPERQKKNMENFMALSPDIITCQPQELDIAASTFDPLVEKGIKLVFLSNVPTGYEPGKQYVSAITDDLVGMGEIAADAMAEAIGGEGKIIAITLAAVNYVCNTRDTSFVSAIKEKYPNIEIVGEGGFQKVSEAGMKASGLLTRYPDVKGIYVSFSVPAIDVLEAVRSLGRSDIKIVVMDLDTVLALDMIQGGNVYSIIADSPYSLGYGIAILGAYGVLGKPAPKYLTSPGFAVKKDNVLDAWKWSFGTNPPDDLMSAINK